MKPEHWISIAQIAITLMGMFVASKLAVSSSLKQFRSQKWWERQGDVYNRLLENLAVIKHCVGAWLDHERRPDYMLGPSKLLEEQLANAAAEVEKIGAVGPYYLSAAASKAVDKFVAGWGVHLGGGDEDEYERHLKTINESMAILREEASKSLGLQR
jgi:hypothetical protein